MHIEQAIKEALEASAPIARELFLQGQNITKKRDGSIVTESDQKLEAFLHERLGNALPDAYFLGEESSEENRDVSDIFEHEYLWAIDPIDGTNNFANGIPLFATSIGLLQRTERGHVPIAGGIILPMSGELMYTMDGKSYRVQAGEEKEIQRRTDFVGKRSLTLSSSFFNKFTLTGEYKSRQLGSTVANIAYVATGNSVASITNAHLWDVAGVLPIAHEQGVHMRSLETDEIKDAFTIEDFHTTPEQWLKFKETYVISDEENYAFMKENLTRK